jgi:choice-of-anchor B domain-containing protein
MVLRRRSIVETLAVGLGLGLFTAAAALAGFPSENVSMYSHVTLGDFGASFAEDSWGYVSPSGREYAIIGLSTGTGFVEITNPAKPVIVAVMAQPNRGRDMKVYQNYVYSSSDSGPTHVYDVSDIDNGVITHVRSFNKGTHNLAVDEVSGFLYLAVGGPMDVYDLSDPSDPTFVGSWPGQTHDAQVVTYTEGPYAGRQIAFVFAGWDGWLDIVDVTDKTNMFLVGQTGYPSAVYTHHGWLSADRQYLYISDEVDEIARTTIIDVSDLSDPTFISDFTNGLQSTDHNLYVRNGFIFEANYTSGLRIFDASDPVNPVEVGYFDTYPPDNDEGYDGAWNAYPFFPSRTVIVSDRSGGLFVLLFWLAGDCDVDGDRDLDDFEIFDGCYTGPGGGPVGPGCKCSDLDDDDDVDWSDFELLQLGFTGG